MDKPLKKMSKDEKTAYAYHKIIKGVGLFIFGLIWMYFTTGSDVWSALPPTLTIFGLLIILYGLFKKYKA